MRVNVFMSDEVEAEVRKELSEDQPFSRLVCRLIIEALEARKQKRNSTNSN